jgi:predicted TIM-barrel fold metal-dependent hydrolase
MPRPAAKEPVVVVTADTHVGPSLRRLREYCPRNYLEDFDAFAAKERTAPHPTHALLASVEHLYRQDPSALEDLVNVWFLSNSGGSAGIEDVTARLADMDADGVAAEVIFHGTPNSEGIFESIPFQTVTTIAANIDQRHWDANERQAAAEGCRIYNRWLVDFCSVAPERHVALAQIPVWDIEASVDIVRWAAKHGMRGVNFPRPQANLPPYEDPNWDPLFAVCSELALPLTTHVGGAAFPPAYKGPGMSAIRAFEYPMISGRNLWHMIFAGVFDRHPGLTLVLTEIPGPWFANVICEMESIYGEHHRLGPIIRRHLKRRPREYVETNVFFGCSFMSRPDLRAVQDLEVVNRVMWGSDYPHSEGTWLCDADPDGSERPDHGGRPTVTRLSLAETFTGVAESDVRKMVGGNAVACYGLDPLALATVAERIGPGIEELTTAPDLSLVPERYVGLGFRTGGTWA